MNPDGSVVAVVMNATDEDHEIGLSMDGHAVEVVSPKRSMMTAVMERVDDGRTTTDRRH